MTHDERPDGFKYRTLTWSVGISLTLMLLGCNNALIIRVINQGTEGNNEIWVCDGGSAEPCRGEKKGRHRPRRLPKALAACRAARGMYARADPRHGRRH